MFRDLQGILSHLQSLGKSARSVIEEMDRDRFVFVVSQRRALSSSRPQQLRLPYYEQKYL